MNSDRDLGVSWSRKALDNEEVQFACRKRTDFFQEISLDNLKKHSSLHRNECTCFRYLHKNIAWSIRYKVCCKDFCHRKWQKRAEPKRLENLYRWLRGPSLAYIWRITAMRTHCLSFIFWCHHINITGWRPIMTNRWYKTPWTKSLREAFSPISKTKTTTSRLFWLLYHDWSAI